MILVTNYSVFVLPGSTVTFLFSTGLGISSRLPPLVAGVGLASFLTAGTSSTLPLLSATLLVGLATGVFSTLPLLSVDLAAGGTTLC